MMVAMAFAAGADSRRRPRPSLPASRQARQQPSPLAGRKVAGQPRRQGSAGGGEGRAAVAGTRASKCQRKGSDD